MHGGTGSLERRTRVSGEWTSRPSVHLSSWLTTEHVLRTLEDSTQPLVVSCRTGIVPNSTSRTKN